MYYTGTSVCLVRISVRRGVLHYLPGHWSISKEDAFKTKFIRVNPVHCWEEGERCRNGAELWAAWLCCWCLHCEGRCYYNGLSNTSSDPQPQKEASLLGVLPCSARELCNWTRSCPFLLLWNQSPNWNMSSLFLKNYLQKELEYSQRDSSCQKTMLLNDSVLHPFKPEMFAKLYSRIGSLPGKGCSGLLLCSLGFNFLTLMMKFSILLGRRRKNKKAVL